MQRIMSFWQDKHYRLHLMLYPKATLPISMAKVNLPTRSLYTLGINVDKRLE